MDCDLWEEAKLLLLFYCQTATVNNDLPGIFIYSIIERKMMTGGRRKKKVRDYLEWSSGLVVR